MSERLVGKSYECSTMVLEIEYGIDNWIFHDS